MQSPDFCHWVASVVCAFEGVCAFVCVFVCVCACVCVCVCEHKWKLALSNVE